MVAPGPDMEPCYSNVCSITRSSPSSPAPDRSGIRVHPHTDPVEPPLLEVLAGDGPVQDPHRHPYPLREHHPVLRAGVVVAVLLVRRLTGRVAHAVEVVGVAAELPFAALVGLL